MTNSQDLKFNAIENTDAIVGIDIAKNVHWAGIILPNGKEVKKSFSFHNNKKGFESLVETVKNVLTIVGLSNICHTLLINIYFEIPNMLSLFFYLLYIPYIFHLDFSILMVSLENHYILFPIFSTFL